MFKKMLNKLFKASFLFALLLAVLSCQKESIDIDKTTQQVETQQTTKGYEVIKASAEVKNKNNEDKNWRQGTITYLNFEGGFYGIIDDNKMKLLPLNLAPEYKNSGTIIRFKGMIKEDLMTTQQWGTAFTITDIELIKLGKDSQNPTF